MCHGVHARGGGEEGREIEGVVRVEHRVVRDQGEVVHHELEVRGLIHDDGGEGRLAARTRRGGNREGGRALLPDTQVAAEVAHAALRPGHPRADCLGAVHGAAAAEADDCLAALLVVERQRRLHVGDGGVGGGTVIDGAGKARLAHRLLQRLRQPERADAPVRHQQGAADAELTQLCRNFPHGLDGLRLPVGQDGQRRAERGLIRAAVRRFQNVHGKIKPFKKIRESVYAYRPKKASDLSPAALYRGGIGTLRIVEFHKFCVTSANTHDIVNQIAHGRPP